MKTSVFDLIRERVSALDVAEHAGLALKRRGSRSWVCCSLHGEKTPSLCFYEDGGWHCFGCHKGGDAVALYAALYRLPMGEAARRLAAEWGLVAAPAGVEADAPATLTAGDMRRTVMEWYNKECGDMRELLDIIDAVLRTYTIEEAEEDEETFTQLMEVWGWASIRLHVLMNMDDEEIIQLYMNGGHERVNQQHN